MRALHVLLALATALLSLPASAADRFKIDPTHSSFGFLIGHLGYAQVLGRFGEFEGEFSFSQTDIAANTIRLSIKSASIDTNLKARDDHLRSPDFFNAAEFPALHFVSTRVEKSGEMSGKVTGNLTLLGVTKPVTLDVTFNKAAPHPLPRYNQVLTSGFSVRGTIKRSDWGMKYGLPGLSDDVQLIIEIEGHKI